MASLWKREGSKYWIACFTDASGRRLKRSTKETDKRKAQRIADSYEDAARRRRTAIQVRKVIADVTKEITGDDLATISLRDYSERWLGRKKGSLAPSSFDSYASAVRGFVEFMNEKADRDIDEVTRDEVTAFRDHEANRVSPNTANKSLKRVRMLFLDAERDAHISEDPARHVKAVPREKRATERKAFTIPQIEAVLSVASDEWGSLVIFGLYTGQRLGDLASLTWDNIDLKRNEIRLVTGKTRRAQRLVIAPALRAHIESLPANDQPDAPIHPKSFETVEKQGGRVNTLSRQFGELLASAGLREKKKHRGEGKGRTGRRETHALTFHSLRRTATTLLHELGVAPSVAQALIGHDSEEIHAGYVSVGRKALSDAAAKLPTLEG